MQFRALALGMLIIFIEIYNLSHKEGDAENSSALEQNDLQKYFMNDWKTLKPCNVTCRNSLHLVILKTNILLMIIY